MTRLRLRSRLLVAAAAMLLAGTFVLPLWKIELHAPQYPEGIGMLIRIDTLTGMKPADLDNLNGLNHYIGMKAITPDAFPALEIMPWVVGILIVFALVVAATAMRALLIGWLATVAVAGMAGFAEFYRWTYRYGHDLAPDAIIKVPGMTYQPPLLGSKQLLNFTADSWPGVGGWLAVIAFMLGVIALLPLFRRTRAASAKPGPGSTVSATPALSTIAATLLALITACGNSGTPAVAYGRADCDVCLMRIVDNRYGGAAVTGKGKLNEFDSIECLVNYADGVSGLRALWVTDFDHPGTLVDATHAKFVHRGGPGAEMGANLLAFSNSADTASIKSRFGASPMSWTEIQLFVKQNRQRRATNSAVEHSHGA